MAGRKRGINPTAPQQAVLDFIIAAQGAVGYPPSVNEITRHFGWSSPNAAECHLKALVARGLIKRRPGTWRGMMVCAKPEATLYGFFYNPCYHESAAAMMSLHQTKAGAWHAMRKHKFGMAVDQRDWAIQLGGRRMMRRSPVDWELHFIKAVEVQP